MVTEQSRERPGNYFRDWKEREALAEAMIPLVGKLSRENSVKTYIYGKSLVNGSVLDIMQDHRYVRQVEQNELSEGCLLRVAGYAGLVVGALLGIATNETELGTFLMGLGALILIAGQIASLRR